MSSVEVWPNSNIDHETTIPGQANEYDPDINKDFYSFEIEIPENPVEPDTDETIPVEENASTGIDSNSDMQHSQGCQVEILSAAGNAFSPSNNNEKDNQQSQNDGLTDFQIARDYISETEAYNNNLDQTIWYKPLI